MAEEDGHDGVGSRIDAEPGGRDLFAEHPGVALEAVLEFGRLPEDLENFESGSGDGRRQRIRENVGARPLAEKLDDLSPAGDAAARGPAQGLAEGRCDDVHATHDPAVLVGAAARRPDDSGGVRVVDQDQAVVSIGQVADPVQAGDDAVHGEDAVGHDHPHPSIPGLLQAGFEFVHVVVPVDQAPGTAETDSVDDRGVVELIGNDGRVLVEERLEDAAVCIECRRIEKRVVHAQEFRKGLLQILMDLLGAADETDGGHAETPAEKGIIGGGHNPGLVAETQVIVGAEIEDFESAFGLDLDALGRRQDPFFFVKALGFYGFNPVFQFSHECFRHASLPLPPVGQAGRGLVRRHDDHLADVDMRRPVGAPDDGLGDVVGRKRGQSLVDFFRPLSVAVEADQAELGFDHARIDRRDTDARPVEVQAKGPAGCGHRKLARAVDIATGINFVSGDGSDVDDMAAAALDHAANDGPADIEKPFDVRVDHLFPVLDRSFMDRAQATAKSGVVDQDVDVLPFGGKGGDGGVDGFPVPDIESENMDIGSAGCAEFGSQGFETIQSPGARQNPRAPGGKGPDAGPADPRTRPRDINNPIFERHGGHLRFQPYRISQSTGCRKAWNSTDRFSGSRA